ncbi:MAG TPA: hypothetical protein VK986_23705, partial [Tepidisphaeraceae bacterium]|nr:hypothetical protein [Tepidisphaeraceae bacterium]
MKSRTGPRHEASALWAVEGLEPRALLAAGALDPTFGQGGLVTTDLIGRANTDGRAVVALEGGKFLVGGQASAGDGVSTFADALVARYNADGTLDASFGDGGRVGFDLNSAGAAVTDMIALPGGKFLMAGGANGTFVARFNADGTPDASFGDGGFFRYPTASTFNTRIALAPDGKIVGLTSTHVPDGHSTADLVVFRLTSAGRADTSFGSGGVTVLDFNGGHENVGGIAVRPDGRVVGNAAWRSGGVDPDKVLIFQLTPGGQLDPSFGDNGKVLGDLFGGGDDLRDLKLDAAGRILILNNDAFGFSVARFKANGVFDRSFGERGIAATNVSAMEYGAHHHDAARLLLRPDGSIVAVGTADVNADNGPKDRIAIAQFTAAGRPDAFFGSNGLTRLARTGTYGRAAALLPGGKLLIVGSAGNRATAVRANAAGVADATFAPGGADGAGWVDLDAQTSAFQYGVDVAVQADGKMVVAGSTRDPDGANPVVFRYLPNGQLDPTFGDGGVVRLEMPDGFEGLAAGVTIGADGQIIVGGMLHAKHELILYGGFVHWLDATGRPVVVGGATRRMQSGMRVTAVRVDARGRLVYVEQHLDASLIVHRLNADGTPDPSFSGDGQVSLPTRFGYPGQHTLRFGPDSKILFGGSLESDVYYTEREFAVLRLNADGTVDTTFGDGGIGTVGGSGYWGDVPVAMALQSDGRIVLAGTHSVYMGSSYVVARMSTNGRPDTNFGTGGYTIQNRGASYPMDFGSRPDGATFVAVAADGTIVVAGYNDMPTEGVGGPHPFTNDFGVFRLLPSGELDWSFGDRGWTFVSFGAQDSPGGGFVKDGQLTLVGLGQPASTASDVALARLNLMDPTPVTAVIAAGVLKITGSAAADSIRLARGENRIRITGVAGSFAAGS